MSEIILVYIIIGILSISFIYLIWISLLKNNKLLIPGNIENEIKKIELQQAINRGEYIKIIDEYPNHIILFKNINYNDQNPFHLLPEEEIIIYDKLPGSDNDFWHYNSLQFKGEINYQIKITTGLLENDYKLIDLYDYSDTGIPNI